VSILSDRIDVYPYKRVAGSNFYARTVKKNSGSILRRPFWEVSGLFSPAVILAGAVAFFVGRAVLLGELAPFAPAYAVAAAVTFRRRGILITALLCAGVATVTEGYRLAAYLALIIYSFLFAQAVPPKYSGRWPVVPMLTFGITLSIESAFSAYTGSTPYDYISFFFEAVFASALAPACMASFSAARKLNGIKPLSVEETVCLLVVMAGTIAGTGDLHLWHVTAKGFLSRTVILLAALAGGAGLGAAAGAVVGIIPGLSYTVTPYLVGAYSFAGMLSGLGRILGKIGVALSFLASNIILSIYFNNFASMESVIAETSLACLAFLLIPEGYVRLISTSVMGEAAMTKPDNSRDLFVNTLKGRFKDYAAVFRELARAFGEYTVLNQKKDNDQSLKQLMGEISKKVCEGCGMFRLCWEKDYYRTYQNMLDMFMLTEVYGRIRVADMPEDLKLRCTRPRELTITATCLYEAFKVDRYWQKKLSTGKGVVADQLMGMASVIDTLSEEFDFNPQISSDADLIIKQKLRQMGIPVKEIRVSETGGQREIYVAMKACRGELNCRYRVAPAVSDLMALMFAPAGCLCEGLPNEGMCRFRLYQAPLYSIEVGSARAGKDGSPVCGDVYDFIQLKGGRFAAVLSDGMGSGEQAARESTSAVALLRRMLEAGLEIEIAVKSVNSVQALKNPDEAFATLDMAVINLYSGQAEFVKIATPPTFLVRGGRIRLIQAGSLPVGILSDIDVSVTEKKLASGDVIVMLTDGITDAYKESPDKDNWVTGVLQELHGLHPKEMAELLLKLAQTGSGGELRTPDDMAVVVIRVEKEKVVEIPRKRG
jgi:stage II sporulation protein E